jgi:hypothetical protein
VRVNSILYANSTQKPNRGDSDEKSQSSSASSSIPQSMVPMEQNDASEATSPDSQAEKGNHSTASILGLWKFVLYAGGELNDAGFEQFSAGGTELANDAGAFNTGNNFCIGAWKQVGARSYDLVHPFFFSTD